jgi:ribosomal protein S27AE
MYIIKSPANRKENMTKVVRKTIQCVKCGKESEQMAIYSVNFALGDKADNENLMKHQQVCPHCGYTAKTIDIEEPAESESIRNDTE